MLISSFRPQNRLFIRTRPIKHYMSNIRPVHVFIPAENPIHGIVELHALSFSPLAHILAYLLKVRYIGPEYLSFVNRISASISRVRRSVRSRPIGGVVDGRIKEVIVTTVFLGQQHAGLADAHFGIIDVECPYFVELGINRMEHRT